jgi:HK97 family phage portal protein
MDTHGQYLCLHDGNAFEVSNLSSGTYQPAQWFLDWATGGLTSDSGMAVNGYTALTSCALWQGINIIAGDIGQVPFRLVKDEFTDQTTHPAWKLTRIRPNELQTPSLFKETLMQWALMFGNFVGWIHKQGSKPTDIIPLRPDCLRPELVRFDDGQIMLYHYYSPSTGREFTFFPDDVVHIQGLTGDGIWGYPLYQIGKNTIGLGLALEKHANKQFSNGARPSGVLKHPSKMSPEARANFRSEWNAIHEGPDNSGKIAILWEGMDFMANQMTNVDSQAVEIQKDNAICVARLLNIPAYRLNVIDASSNRANLEEQNENYKQTTLTRWTNRINEEFSRKLLTEVEWLSGRFAFKPEFDAFLGPDIETKSNIATQLVINTIWNPNEARAWMGYAPREGGEKYGNPAINPEEPADADNASVVRDEQKPVEEAETTENKADKAFFELLADRFTHLFETEGRILANASQGELPEDMRNFVEFVDSFYGGDNGTCRLMTLYNSICQKSVNAASAAGLNVEKLPEIARSWAEKRRLSLLDVCDRVTPPELPAAVKQSFLDTAAEDRASGWLQLMTMEN